MRPKCLRWSCRQKGELKAWAAERRSDASYHNVPFAATIRQNKINDLTGVFHLVLEITTIKASSK